ncbi:hypothetical protein [Rhizobium sp. LjRoot254]|uniref:hypothetical protein n=1 Tax=Rhizobium sp. LjRoot254 TaxID=3342297 RepID=UPI003ED11BC4
MYGKLLVASLAVLLCSCSENKIDESLVQGNWKVGKGRCGSGIELTYHDGSLSILNASTNEHVPVFEILSAERKGDEAWIQYRPVLTSKPAKVAEVVFRIDDKKYVGVRLFSGQEIAAIPGAQQAFTWTRCHV